MQGKVKWFSRDKGFGYIVGGDGIEAYFNIKDIIGSNLPRNGDLVSYECVKNSKGIKALSVEILKENRQETNGSQRHNGGDHRETCVSCQKKMVPRMAMREGAPYRSYCPYCGAMHKDFSSNCFIATAVYGDKLAPEVVALRRFRDEKLSTSRPGRMLVSFYYRTSPPIAEFLKRHPSVSEKIKPFLNGIADKFKV